MHRLGIGGLLIVALSIGGMLLLITVTEGQQTSPPKVKLTGPELEQLFISRHAVIAGVNHTNNCVFMTVSFPGGAREQYYNCTSESGTAPGTSRLNGDQICFTYPRLFAGLERCLEYYRVSDDKFEGWEGGRHVITFTKVK